MVRLHGDNYHANSRFASRLFVPGLFLEFRGDEFVKRYALQKNRHSVAIAN